jgi:hypothetical protein
VSVSPRGAPRPLFGACQRSASRALDAAVLALLYGAGLRRAEAVAVDLADYQSADDPLTVRSAKGGRERRAFVTGGAHAATAAWLTIRGTLAGPLLCPVRKDGAVTIRRMTADALYRRLARLGGHAGVARFSPDDLRRSFVSDLLDAGADLAAVQAHAGHRRPETTVRYDRRPDTARRRAPPSSTSPTRRPDGRRLLQAPGRDVPRLQVAVPGRQPPGLRADTAEPPVAPQGVVQRPGGVRFGNAARDGDEGHRLAFGAQDGFILSACVPDHRSRSFPTTR